MARFVARRWWPVLPSRRKSAKSDSPGATSALLWTREMLDAAADDDAGTMCNISAEVTAGERRRFWLQR